MRGEKGWRVTVIILCDLLLTLLNMVIETPDLVIDSCVGSLISILHKLL